MRWASWAVPAATAGCVRGLRGQGVLLPARDVPGWGFWPDPPPPPSFHPGSATSGSPHRFPGAGGSVGMREVGNGHRRSRRGAKPELLRGHLPHSGVTRGGKAHPGPPWGPPQLRGVEETGRQRVPGQGPGGVVSKGMEGLQRGSPNGR